MAISLTSLRNELLPGLDAIERAGRQYGQNIVAYQAFERDVLVLKAGDQTLEIARSELEDRRHIPRLRAFLEKLMCVKVAGNVAPPPQVPSAIENQFYDAFALTRAATRDNQFLAEMTGPYNASVMPPGSSEGVPLKPIEPAKPAASSWPPAPDLILDEPC